MPELPEGHDTAQSGGELESESREIELALPEWLADEFRDGDAIIPNIPDIPASDEEPAEENAGSYPAVATAWIDPSATRILTERAALLALVASQTRGAGWGAEPPMLAPIAPPVTLESLELDDGEPAGAAVPEDHLPLPLVAAGLLLIVAVVVAGLLVWYFELL